MRPSRAPRRRRGARDKVLGPVRDADGPRRVQAGRARSAMCPGRAQDPGGPRKRGPLAGVVRAACAKVLGHAPDTGGPQKTRRPCAEKQHGMFFFGGGRGFAKGTGPGVSRRDRAGEWVRKEIMCRGQARGHGAVGGSGQGERVFRVMSRSVHVHVMEPRWGLPAGVRQAAAEHCPCACDKRSHESGASPDAQSVDEPRWVLPACVGSRIGTVGPVCVCMLYTHSLCCTYGIYTCVLHILGYYTCYMWYVSYIFNGLYMCCEPVLPRHE